MRSSLRSPDWTCDLWTDGRHVKFGVVDAAGSAFPHHVQVNSGVESQFETDSSEKEGFEPELCRAFS